MLIRHLADQRWIGRNILPKAPKGICPATDRSLLHTLGVEVVGYVG